MPELPEVETTVRALRRAVLGKKIKSANSETHQLFENKSILDAINTLLTGDIIKSIDRHGKYLIFDLQSGRTLVAHMKMTGHFLVINKKLNIKNQNYVRLEIVFADNTKLLFSDARKFGRIWILADGELESFFAKRNLAHDAVSKLCTKGYLYTQLSKKRAIKALLLDQTCIAGIGNIYSDEILWAARIHPQRKGRDLVRKEIDAIFRAMGDILKEGIRAGGSSMRDYRRPDGSSGYFQTKRRVYQREGEPCPRCKTPIQRVVVAQRGTHFCSKCQK